MVIDYQDADGHCSPLWDASAYACPIIRSYVLPQ
jgi:hypothetical protein